MEPRELSIADASTRIGNGELSSVELVSSCMDQIDEHNARLRAFIHVRNRQDVIADARRADERRRNGEQTGLLDGIPIGLKANYACAGLPTTAGSTILAQWRPARDAVAVANLRRAGAVILGMANMHEFANGPTNENPHYGPALNPHDTERSPGGSSGGSAVALATNMCLGATGSDTGGSIRIPAALSGVVGLKPTYGSVSVDGVVPFSRSLDHAGPMARTAQDALTLLRAMTANSAPAGHHAAPVPGRGRPVLGVELDHFGRYLQPGVRRAFDSAVDMLQAIGYDVREVRWPRVAKAGAAELAILFPEAAAVHHHFLETRLEDYSRDVRLSLLSGRLYRAVDYVNAQELRAKLRRPRRHLRRGESARNTHCRDRGTSVGRHPRTDRRRRSRDTGSPDQVHRTVQPHRPPSDVDPMRERRPRAARGSAACRSPRIRAGDNGGRDGTSGSRGLVRGVRLGEVRALTWLKMRLRLGRPRAAISCIHGAKQGNKGNA